MSTSANRNSALKLAILTVLAIALGCAVIFCVLQVSDFNNRAAILQACLDTKSSAPGCPSTPVNTAQVENLHKTADTIGDIGWVAFFLLIFSVGDAVMDLIRSNPSNE